MRAFILLLFVVFAVASAFEFEFDLFNHESLLSVATAEPTADPTIRPSAVPSAVPTEAPTADPTFEPSLPPTLLPTLAPTVAPTKAPTIAPTKAPTLAPTCSPSLEPTARPSNPSAKPTRMPTKSPTYRPSVSPTKSPTEVPTYKPTALNLIAVVATQDLYGITPSEYLLSRALYNRTLQHTISDVLSGVEPEDIKNIALTGGSRRRMADIVTASLSYQIIFHDDTFSKSYDTVVAELSLAAQNGDMNRALHTNAATFGATALVATNVSATVETAPLYPDRAVSDKLTGTEITGLIIGIFLCLGLIVIVAMFALQVLNNQKQSGAEQSPAASPEAPANPPSDNV